MTTLEGVELTTTFLRPACLLNGINAGNKSCWWSSVLQDADKDTDEVKVFCGSIVCIRGSIYGVDDSTVLVEL